MMANDNEIKAAATGAALLDERIPGWYNDIDIYSLDVSDACKCVMGQIGNARVPLDERGASNPYGVTSPYCAGLTLLWPGYYDDDAAEESIDTDAAELHGFEHDTFGDVFGGLGTQYDGLTEAWKAEILRRREGDVS